MKCPFKTPSPKKKPVPNDTWYFKDMADLEVVQCDHYDECMHHEGTYETPEENACGGPWFRDCRCRPVWYLKKMKEQE